MNASGACWSCAKALDARDAYCRYCGQGQGEHVGWWYHPLGIAFLTFCGIGPLSLVLIWKSPVLSPRARWISGALVLGFTAYLVVATVRVVRMLQAVLSGAL